MSCLARPPLHTQDLHLLLQQGPQHVVDTVLGHQVLDLHRRGLADTVTSVLGLNERSQGPEQLGEDSPGRCRERDRHPSRSDTQQGRPQEPASYVRHFTSADSVLGDLSDKLGMTMSEIVETLQTQGIDGFAKKLQVAPALVQEMRELVATSAEHFYADNIIASWDAGRHTPGMEGRSIDEKVAVGVLQRAGGLMQHLQQSIPADAPTPEDVQKSEKLITAIIRELPEPIQKAM